MVWEMKTGFGSSWMESVSADSVGNTGDAFIQSQLILSIYPLRLRLQRGVHQRNYILSINEKFLSSDPLMSKESDISERCAEEYAIRTNNPQFSG